MNPAQKLPPKAWVHALPQSRVPRPAVLVDWPKYLLWLVITPVHPYVRDSLTYLGVLRHKGRQHYLLGKLAATETFESVISYLIDQGFGNHFVAWRDEGEIASLRKVPDFRHQFHIRFFQDGEVRGHYEYTPEFRPFDHLLEIGAEDRRQEFLEVLGDRIIPA
ncbi:MAG TPA: hypothetical protein VMT80_01595 [Candidatus Paceibacterota bacterium]|nr:hypothetical protein [Candidatus Paceibacterota bacterium]